MNALSTTFYELLADNLSTRGQAQALVDADRSVSYSELALEVEHLCTILQAEGVVRGDRVIVHLRKGIAEAAAMFAVAKLGAVAVNVNVQWTLSQLRYVQRDSGARLLIVEPKLRLQWDQTADDSHVGDARVDVVLLTAGSATAAAEGTAAGRPVWQAGQRAAQLSPAMPCLDQDLAFILYTSGSTGQPKGVMLSHRNIVTGARSVARYLKLGDDERLLSVLPYSFDYGLNQLTTMMLMGGTVVHQPVPMAAEIVAALQRHQITGLAAVPPLWSQIVRLLEKRPAALPSLRRVTNSGGKIPSPVLQRMPVVFPGVDVYLMYGLTEAFRSTYLPPERFAQKMGSIGQAIPGAEVYVVQHGKGLAPRGEIGELVHRGPLVSLGYWQRAEATRLRLRPCPELAHLIGDECVAYSGDLVRADEDGDLWFMGREDAMIKTSGFRLSPEEVEEGLAASGLVAEVVAFGVADDEMGEVVHAAVVPLVELDPAALLAHCQKNMAHYMVPRRLHLWPLPMPRTASGKLDRPAVVAACRTERIPTAPALGKPAGSHH